LKSQGKSEQKDCQGSTRKIGKLVNNLIEGERPKHEVREMLDKLQSNFNELEMKHEAHTELIDNDHKFEDEQAWLGKCHEDFMDMECQAKVYLDMFDERKGKTIVDGKGS